MEREYRCSRCARDNRPDARFCDACGTELGDGPPTGAGEVRASPRAYTPRHLAERVLVSRSALEGERKQVTVLFADVQDSTGLAARLDPERWHATLDRFFQILAEAIHRFEGTINQFTGDGIMALFGAPLAHEDHAQRACHAALELTAGLRSFEVDHRARTGLPFPVRIGLNSGEVVVGKIGDDLRMDYTAQGHTVALAARVQEVATPGTPLLGPETARAARGYFELQDLGPRPLKGIEEPVSVFALRGRGRLRTRLDVARARGFSPLLGREPELGTLRQARARALDGVGQVVGVVGDAGVGKSRLLSEFIDECRSEGMRVCEAHCPAHARTIPWLAIGDLLRDDFGIGAEASAAESRASIRERLAALGGPLRDSLPLVCELLSVSEPGPAPAWTEAERAERLAEFAARWVQAASASEPLVLLLDDVHWIDAESDGLLRGLVDALGWTRTLLLANFRPEYPAAWLSGSYCTRLELGPLAPDAENDLLAALLGDDPSVRELPARVRERTGGNPFYVEEVVRDLRESGVLVGEPGRLRARRSLERLEIPATVQAVLSARTDRLEETHKRVLQTASVIGRSISTALLARVTELPQERLRASLDRLSDLGLLRVEAATPGAGDRAEGAPERYAFQHPLTQEVCYRSQLAGPRSTLHSAVADALEELHSERLGEVAALIAHHWEAAGSRFKARRWRQRAALRVSHIQIRRRRKEW